MGTSSWLATWLDAEHLLAQGATIYPALRPGGALPPARSGAEIARELTGRLLIQYLTPGNVRRYQSGRNDACYATPTAYAPEETKTWLQLPGPEDRTYALILDPSRVPLIQGPYWVALGRGLQYLLPEGFPPEAIVVPGAPGVQWEIEVR